MGNGTSRKRATSAGDAIPSRRSNCRVAIDCCVFLASAEAQRCSASLVWQSLWERVTLPLAAWFQTALKAWLSRRIVAHLYQYVVGRGGGSRWRAVAGTEAGQRTGRLFQSTLLPL